MCFKKHTDNNDCTLQLNEKQEYFRANLFAHSEGKRSVSLCPWLIGGVWLLICTIFTLIAGLSLDLSTMATPSQELLDGVLSQCNGLDIDILNKMSLSATSNLIAFSPELQKGLELYNGASDVAALVINSILGWLLSVIIMHPVFMLIGSLGRARKSMLL